MHNIVSTMYFCTLCVLVTFAIVSTVNSENRSQKSQILSCQCAQLQCNCCGNISQQEVCAIINVNPNDFLLTGDVSYNGQPILKGFEIFGPDKLPICASPAPVCFVVKQLHVEKDNLKVCSALQLGPSPIGVDLPCILFSNGVLSVET